MYSINPYVIIPLLALIINTFTMAYIYALGGRNPLNRSFCLFTAGSILWVSITFFIYLPVDPRWATPLLRAAAVAWLPMGFLIMNLVYTSQKKRKDIIYWACLGLLIIFIPAGAFTKLVTAGHRSYPWGYWQVEGPLFLPSVAVVIIIPVAYSLFLSVRHMGTLKNAVEFRTQVFLLAGPFLNLLAALVLEIVIPRFFDASLFRLTPSSTVISSILIFYAIRKYSVFAPDILDMAADIFLTIRDGIMLLDSRGKILTMNDAAMDLFHLKKTDGASINIVDLIEGYRIENDYKDHEIETVLGGGHRNLLITQSSMPGNESYPGKVLTIKDITPQKKLLNDVLRSEERFRFLVEDISETIFSLHSDGTIDYISPVIKLITGWAPEEIIGRPCFEFIHPDDLAKVGKRFTESLSGIDGQTEFRIRARDGSYRHVMTSSRKIEHNGEIYGIRGVMTNITEYKKIKQELEDSQRLYRLIANSVTDKIWIYDLGGMEIIYTSPAVRRLNGRTPKEEMLMPLEERIEKDSLAHAMAVLGEELEHDAERDPDRVRSVEFVEKHSDGRWINTEASITFLRNGSGKPFQLLGVSRDITERKILEQELVKTFGEIKQRNDLIEKDLATARLIHQKLIPSSLPILEQFRVGFRYLPLEAVGGDYFNIIDLKEGGLGVFVGDVTGHGVSAALFLSLVKSVTNNLLRDHALDPGEFLYHLNNELYRHMQSYFITAIYGLFRTVEGSDDIRFTFANGGHPAPLLYRAGQGKVESLYARGTAIGAFELSRFSVGDTIVHGGDRIFLYTDGLVEVLNEDRQLLGFDSLPDIVLRAHDDNLQKTMDSIIKEVHRFRGKMPLDDDIVLLGIEVK